jgi:hypothetical protein
VITPTETPGPVVPNASPSASSGPSAPSDYILTASGSPPRHPPPIRLHGRHSHHLKDRFVPVSRVPLRPPHRRPAGGSRQLQTAMRGRGILHPRQSRPYREPRR